jgi:uncharacterized protein YidB (DUF937 family)
MVAGQLAGRESAGDPALAAALKALVGGGSSGGLADLVQRFERGGYGGVVQSWIGNGQNQSIAPQDLQQAIGDDKVQQASAESGLPVASLLPLLAQVLPSLIDRLTPNGRIPEGGVAQQEVDEALRR